MSPSGAQLLLCSLPKDNFGRGQAFGLQQTSTGLVVSSAGSACNAMLVTETSSESWPPQIKLGETWQLSLVQGQTTVAAWTLGFGSNVEEMVVDSATGTNESKVEASFIRENPPAPNLLNTWIFALSSEGTTPFYCIFTQEKPFADGSMTGTECSIQQPV